MIDNETVGVGILTCNRKDNFEQLEESILDNKAIDYLVCVKNRSFDYDGNFGRHQRSVHYIDIPDDVGVGHCKNQALKYLMNKARWINDKPCQHMFLIEDDIQIKDQSVFQKYIETAKHFNLGHLNWNTLPENKASNRTYVIQDREFSIDISFRLCGCFSYFSFDALQQCGLIDAVNYVNVLEHVEHAYRFAAQKLTTPFYAFAGIHDGEKYLSYSGGTSSTIDHDSKLYQQRQAAACLSFASTYGRSASKIHFPNIEEVKQFLISKQRDKHA